MPSISPMSWMRTTCLCVIWRASRSSRLKRCSTSAATLGSALTSGLMTLSATATPSSSSHAWYLTHAAGSELPQDPVARAECGARRERTPRRAAFSGRVSSRHSREFGIVYRRRGRWCQGRPVGGEVGVAAGRAAGVTSIARGRVPATCGTSHRGSSTFAEGAGALMSADPANAPARDGGRGTMLAATSPLLQSLSRVAAPGYPRKQPSWPGGWAGLWNCRPHGTP